MVITDCIFEAIATDTVVIYDNSFRANVEIFDTNIDILSGSFYYASHILSSLVHVENVSITSDQLNPNNINLNNNGLFELSSTDTTSMEDIDVLYSYNVLDNCEFQLFVDSLIPFNYYICKNPKTFLANYGKLTLNFINVDIDTYPDNITQTDLVLYEYEVLNEKDISFIINVGDMNISNMLIYNTISHVFITNQGGLYAEFLSFSSSFSDLYQPNDLHSSRILAQNADDAFIELTQSYFVGSHYILTILGGGAAITNSIFVKNNRIIQAVAASSIVIKNCSCSNMGWLASGRLYLSNFDQVNNKYLTLYLYTNYVHKYIF